MKTWQFWVIILVVVLVIVPLIYFAIVAKSVTEVEKSAVNASILSGIDPSKNPAFSVSNGAANQY